MRPVHAAIASAALAAPLLVVAPITTASAAPGDPDVISDWNTIAVATMAADGATTPPRKAPVEGYLYVAFTHLVMYNAVVGIEGGYEPFHFRVTPPRGASSQAAAVAAAHKVLVTYSPEQASTLDAAYAASLAEIPDGKAETRGVAYGELAADALILQREGDGRNDPSISFTQPEGPGVWRPTPPALAPFNIPWLAYMDPLAVRSGKQFGDPGPPPSLTSKRYTKDFREVKRLGEDDSTIRTSAQTETATFYSGNPIVQFTTALRDQAANRDLDIVEASRLFAAVHTSLADAAISVWWSKFKYGLWRPITAIQLAETDGNPKTKDEDDWNSLIPSPPYPDYVSGYNGVMGAFTQALTETLGTQNLDLTLITTAFPAGDPRATRHYDRGVQARRELIDARVWLGIHFRFADTAGARMGQDVARYVLKHNFEKE
jgi:hypothetical protein